MSVLLFFVVSIVLALVLFYAPYLVITLLLLALIYTLTIDSLEIYYNFFKDYRLQRTDRNDKPFISILVPTHSEPVEIVTETLSALANLAYSNYEVLVIDNNTTDPHLWQPVEAYCRSLGKRFLFYHVENVTGFKAGALNWARQKISEKSKYVAIIDADYIVRPNFLEIALSHMSERLAFVQFPQAYRNLPSQSSGIDKEYRRFFSRMMNMANHYNCVASTGTLTLYDIAVIDEVGLFSPNHITEDADITLKLIQSGHFGRYCPEVVGHGLAPYDFTSYWNQKERWSYGNTIVLKHTLWHLISSRQLSLKQKVGTISLLNAWVNPTFIAICTLVATSFLQILNHTLVYQSSVRDVAAAIILIHFCLKALSFWLDPQDPMPARIRAFLVHWSMNANYASTPFRALLGLRLGFNRTNKSLKHINDQLYLFTEIASALFIGTLTILSITQNYYFSGIALALIAFSHLCAFYVNGELTAARKEYLATSPTLSLASSKEEGL